MRWAVVVLALLSSAALAQVAGLCGPGKRCNVRSVQVGSQADTTSAVCLAPAGSYFWRIYSGSNTLYLGQTATTTSCGSSAGVTPIAWWDFAAQLATVQLNSYSTGYMYAQSGLASGAAANGTAFASFPTCNAAAAGRLLYDSTNNVWRYCDGTSWQIVARNNTASTTTSANFTATCTASPCSTEDVDLQGSYSPRSSSEKSINTISCNAREAGAGGTTGVVVAVNQGATELCNCVISTCAGLTTPSRCSCAAGTLSAAGGPYTLRLKSTTDCTTNPGTIVCNTD